MIGFVYDCGYGLIAQGRDVFQVVSAWELQYFDGLCLGLFGVLGVGGGWHVRFWVGEHPFGRVSESRDAL